MILPDFNIIRILIIWQHKGMSCAGKLRMIFNLSKKKKNKTIASGKKKAYSNSSFQTLLYNGEINAWYHCWIEDVSPKFFSKPVKFVQVPMYIQYCAQCFLSLFFWWQDFHDYFKKKKYNFSFFDWIFHNLDLLWLLQYST